MSKLYEDTTFFILGQAIARTKPAIRPTWIQVTTITITSKLGDHIVLEQVASNVNGTDWVKKSTSFYNQVTLQAIRGGRKRSVKLFRNGSIQVTGCRDLYDCKQIVKDISKIVGHTGPTDFNVHMINTNFGMNGKLNLMKVLEVMRGKDEHRVSFEPDRYAAVKVRMFGKVTCAIFSTGKVIMTGAKNLVHLVECYSSLVSTLEPCIYESAEHDSRDKSIFMNRTYRAWIKKITSHSIKMSSKLGMSDGRCFTSYKSSKITNDEYRKSLGLDTTQNTEYRQAVHNSEPAPYAACHSQLPAVKILPRQ